MECIVCLRDIKPGHYYLPYFDRGSNKRGIIHASHVGIEDYPSIQPERAR